MHALLLSSLDPLADRRREAERQLELASTQPGYGLELVQVGLTDPNVAFGIRQMAMVLLKKHVKVLRCPFPALPWFSIT